MIRVLNSINVEGIHGEVKYQELAGNSNDTKPTEGIATGSTFVEANTGKTYVFDEETSTWKG